MTRSRMPAQIIAGDSLTLSKAAGDYPAADGWAVALTLTPMTGGTPIVVNATDGAQEWAIALTSTASALLAKGFYRYLIAATANGNRSTIEHGQVEVLANPAAVDTDLRSPAQRALDAIDAVLESRAGSQDIEFVFEDGRSIKKIPHADLLALRKHYARIVAREKSKGRGPRRVQVRL